MNECVLCGSKIHYKSASAFLKCNNCHITFKKPENRLPIAEEKNRYLQHNNFLHDEKYLQFLNPALLAITEHTSAGSHGIDYGCGPTLVLSEVINRSGRECVGYDPLFYPLLPQSQVDFITCTEAAEHFFNPATEFEKMFGLLKKRGIIVIMTELLQDKQNIDDWYYAKDPTHVAFYRAETFNYIAEKFNSSILKLEPRLIVLKAG